MYLWFYNVVVQNLVTYTFGKVLYNIQIYKFHEMLYGGFIWQNAEHKAVC
jgi:hypothetical protein